MKLFSIQKYGGPDDGADVLGGPVEEGNVYVSTYGVIVGGSKAPRDLEVGESAFKRYALSGAKPTVYRIVRVK